MRSAVGRMGVGLVAVASLACSNATNPTADAKIERDVSVPPGAIPYITGVHVAAIPAFDNQPALIVTAFNDIGEIVGDSESNVTFASTPFRWTADRGFTFLHVPLDSFFTASAFSVNDRAQVALQLESHTGPTGDMFTAAIWDWQGTVRTLRPLGTGYSCLAESINNFGVLAGSCFVPVDGMTIGSPIFPTV